jgi:diguanylate cyclase (GGDEF)-like protein
MFARALLIRTNHETAHCAAALLLRVLVGLLIALPSFSSRALDIERHRSAAVLADFNRVSTATVAEFASAERDANGAVMLRSGVRGSWFRLSGVDELRILDPPLIALSGGQSLEWTLFLPPDYRPQRYSATDPPASPHFSQRALIARIRAPLTRHAPGYLHVAHAGPRPAWISVESTAEYGSADLRHTKFIYATIAANAVLLLVNLALWITLRDRVYGYFVAYMGGVTLYIALSSGEGFGWPLVSMFRHWAPHGPWFVALVTTIAGVGFVRHFLELDRLAPLLGRVFIGYAVLMAGLALLLVWPWEQPLGWFPMVANAALAVVAPLTLAAALVALIRGGRHAVIYLLGWFPLVLFTTYRTIQLLGVAPDNPIGEYGYYASSTLAALVFSLGLADRSLALSRERDHARAEAESDPLTGTLNRRAIERHLEQAFSDPRSGAQGLAVMMLDLDHFKQINDRYGHLIGDACLMQLVRSVRGELRGGDEIGRWGGEEFVVIARDLDLRGARELAEAIRSRIARDCRVGEGNEAVLVTATIGVAMRGPHHRGTRALLDEADAALYAGKRNGRNRVIVGDLPAAA